MFLYASICSISDFYMDIKLGQAEVPFALREDNIHLSLRVLKNRLQLEVVACETAYRDMYITERLHDRLTNRKRISIFCLYSFR